MISVTISDEAISEISSIFEAKKVPEGYGLRLTVKGGGCAGVDFVLGFDKPSDLDLTYTDYGFNVLIAKKDMMHLIGKHVTFVDSAEVRGFSFEDQNK